MTRPVSTRSTPTVLAIVVLLVLTATTAWATAVAETEANDAPLIVRYPQSVSSIPILALIDEYPEEYSGEFYTDHPQALAQLINGETDLLATGFSVGYTRAQAAGDIVHVATPVWGASAIMATTDTHSVEELAGGTVYAPFAGSPIDLTIRAILEEAGILDEVEIAYAPFPQAAAILVQGRTDAAVLVEPLASKLEIDGTAVRIENLHDGWARVTGGEPRSPQVSVFARRDDAAARSAAISRLTERLAGAVTAVQEDPEAWAARYADVLGFPPAVVERAIQNTYFDAPDERTTRAIIAAYANRLSLAAPDDSFFVSAE